MRHVALVECWLLAHRNQLLIAEEVVHYRAQLSLVITYALE
jgi:hypothetical protein